MAESEGWLSEYGDNRRELGFPFVYWPAAVTLVIGTAGMLWALPVPLEFRAISPLLNWGSAFLMVALVYYFIISVPLAIGMLPFVMAVTAICHWTDVSRYPLTALSAGLTLLSLAGVVAGRGGKGGAQAVFLDIQMMMIGPIWLLSKLYRKLQIPF